MSIEMDIEGIDIWALEMSAAMDDLCADLRQYVLDAGDAGVDAMQRNHTYQDQTYRLSLGAKCELFGRQTRYTATAEISFDAPYAKFVNDGTTKSNAYPFVPTILEAAERKLDECIELGISNFCKRAAGR